MVYNVQLSINVFSTELNVNKIHEIVKKTVKFN